MWFLISFTLSVIRLNSNPVDKYLDLWKTLSNLRSPVPQFNKRNKVGAVKTRCVTARAYGGGKD